MVTIPIMSGHYMVTIVMSCHYGNHCIVSDKNECEVDNGGCEGVCRNTFGSHYCVCPMGMWPKEGNFTQCVGKVLQNDDLHLYSRQVSL